MCPKTSKQFEKERERSKQKIISTALTLFSENGFHATSIRQIASKAEISLGLLYNYFASKEDVLKAILSGAYQTLDSVIETNENLTPTEQLEATINQFLGLLKTQNQRVRMLAQLGLQKKNFKAINEGTFQKHTESVEKIAAALKALNYENPKLEARLIVASLDGLVFESLLMGDKIPVEEVKQHLITKYCK